MTSDLAEYLAGRVGTTRSAEADLPVGTPDKAADTPAETPDSTETPDAAERRRAGRGAVLFGHYEILLSRPLGALCGPETSVFAARDGHGPANHCAYLLKPGLPARLDAVEALRGLRHPSLVEVVDAGVIDWPAEEAQRLVVLTAAPVGQALARGPGQPIRPIVPDRLVPMLIRPLASLLKELNARRVVHGTINPSTLFLSGGAAGALQLGECVTMPAGLAQPVAFETIERGMTEPAGRGVGTIADDLYALGATILACLSGRVPGGEDGDRALLAAKIERGSFAALAGDARLPPALAELARGLLADDEALRWTIDDLDVWLAGRRPAARSSAPPARALRALTFDGRDHWSARGLAAALVANPAAARELIETGALHSWVKRSLKDDLTLARVEAAARSAGTGRAADTARTLARVASALDPAAPIRFKETAVLPSGLGSALVDGATHGRTQDTVELLSAHLPQFWTESQPKPRPDLGTALRKLEEAQAHLERHVPGYGVERCLYELNPSLPCLSPLLERFYVQDLAALLQALETVAGASGRPREPIDRHVAAFAASRLPELSRDVLIALHDQGGAGKRALAMLALLIEVQAKVGAAVPPVPALAAWMVGLLAPVVAEFRSRTLRSRIQTALEEQARAGLLGNLAALVRNTTLSRRDESGFTHAVRAFAVAGRRISAERRRVSDRAALAAGPGRHAAAIVSGALATATAVLMVLSHAG